MNALRHWRATCLLSVALALQMYAAGCSLFASWDGMAKSWVGDPINRITESWGEPTRIWTREDGMTIYQYDLKKLDPSCVHYWVVDKGGIIAGFHYEGYCRPIG